MKDTRRPRQPLLETLEERVHYSAVPVVTVSGGGDIPIGGQVQFTVAFDNASPTDVGYGPYAEIILPKDGADGLFGTDIPDGVSAANEDGSGGSVTATYLGNPVSAALDQVFTDNDGGDPTTGTIEHPFAKDASGNPLEITGNVGDRLLIYQQPFGSVAPDQPPIELEISTNLSNLADLGAPLEIEVTGGFIFGNDPLDNPTSDPSIVQATPATTTVTPTLLSISKSYNGPEAETSTGPNFVRSYTVNITTAPGQTLTNIAINDILDDRAQFLTVSGITDGGVVVSSPSTSTPGGEVEVQFASITDGAASFDIEFYVPELDSGSQSVLNARNGNDQPVENQLYGSATWATPIDPRDSGQTFTVNDPDPNGSPENTFTAKSISVQKGSSLETDTLTSGTSPGDIIEYTIDFQVSDYFSFDQITVSDTMLDGLRYFEDGTRFATLEVSGNGVNLPSAQIDASNISVSLAADNDPSTALTDGSSRIIFNVSDEMVRRGENGMLAGGGIDPNANSLAYLVNDLSGYDGGPVTGRITFYAEVGQTFSDSYPSGRPQVNQGDVLTNNVTIDGRIVNNLSARVATTGNIGTAFNSGTNQITGGPSAIDGVTLSAGDRVLVKDQSATGGAAANGIYVYDGGGTYTRAVDFDQSGEMVEGYTLAVTAGATHGGTRFSLQSPVGTVNTDPVRFLSGDQSAVILATTANIGTGFNAGGNEITGVALTGGNLILDGAAAVVGDRILVKNQTATEQNGIYEVTSIGATEATLTRVADFDDPAEMREGYTVYVAKGGQAGSHYVLQNDVSTVNTTSVNFATQGFYEADGSGDVRRIVSSELEKAIYSVNGNTSFSATSIQPGDEVTYRLKYTIPTGNIDELTIRDFLPLPVFDVDDPDADGLPSGWTFDNTIDAASPAPGTYKFGPEETYSTFVAANPNGGPVNAGLPTFSIDSTSNFLTWFYGNYDTPTDEELVIDLLFTVTVSNQPFADGLFLTNQGNAVEDTTNSNASNADAINQIQLAQPEVTEIAKGVVGYEGIGFSFGDVAFTPPTVATTISGGTVTTEVLADIRDSDERNQVLDSGDDVRFAIGVENTGSADLFDAVLTDTIPTEFAAPTYATRADQIANVKSDLQLELFRGDGTQLTTAAYYDSKVLAASTANVLLGSASRVMDGVFLNTGDRVLLKDQTAASENGIYVVDSVTSTTVSLVRASDFNSAAEINPGGPNYTVTVLGGVNHGNTLFEQTNTAFAGLGDAINWSDATPAGIEYFYTYDEAARSFEVVLADTYDEGDTTDGRFGGLNRAADNNGNPFNDGRNVILATYTLTLNDSTSARSAITNTAKLTNYAGADGAPDHTVQDREDDAVVIPRAPAFSKALVSTGVPLTDWQVRAASTADVNLASPPASLDGITLEVGDWVLLKDQTAAEENGIYRVDGVGAWSRATPLDTAGEGVAGLSVYVNLGNTQADQIWALQNNVATLGTTPQDWAMVPTYGNTGVRWDTVSAVITAPLGAVAYNPTGGPAGTGIFAGALPGTIDGYDLQVGDRILVTGQADARHNGIYEVAPASFNTTARVLAIQGGSVFVDTAGDAGTGQHRGTALTVDGVDLAAGDIILVDAASNQARNGIFQVSDAIDGTVEVATLADLGATYIANGESEGGLTTGRFLGVGNTIDGVTLANNTRVLVKDQANASENGVYTVRTSDATARLATTADLAATFTSGPGNNGTLTNVATTIDGLGLAVGNRVLVKNQTNAEENGLYTVTAVGATATLERTGTFDEPAEMNAGFVVEVLSGTQAGLYALQSSVATVNTDTVDFATTTGLILERAIDLDESPDLLVGGAAGKIYEVSLGTQVGQKFVTTNSNIAGAINWTQTAGHWDRVDYFDDPSDYGTANEVLILEGSANEGALYILTSASPTTINVDPIDFSRTSGTWVRSLDADTTAEMVTGRTIEVIEGINAGAIYELTSTGNVLNTDNIVWSSVVTADNTPSTAVIGESVTYFLRVEVGEGLTQGLRIVDTLPENLAFQEIVSVTTSAGVSIISNAPGTGPSGANVNYDHATRTLEIGQAGTLWVVENTNSSNSQPEFVTIAVRAVVLNSNAAPDNQANTAFENAATFYYTYTNPSGSTLEASVAKQSQSVQVVEPELSISNQLSEDNVTYSDDVTVDAGDTVFYRLVIENTGDIAANDVSLYDRLPDALSIADTTIVSITSSLDGTEYSASDFAIITDNAGGDSRPALVTSATGTRRDLAAGETLTIVVQSKVLDTVVTASTWSNEALVRWTSLDDDVRSVDPSDGSPTPTSMGGDSTPVVRSTYAADAVERTGADGIGSDATTLDNYAADDPVDTTLRIEPVKGFVKVLTGTEIVNAVNANNEAVVGEYVDYSVAVRVPEGVTKDVVLTDTLDPGLAFVGFIGLTIAPDISILTPNGETLDSSDNFPSVPPSNALDSLIGTDITVSNNGELLTFNIGEVTNANSNDDSPGPLNELTQLVIISYRAVVVNTNDAQAGDQLDNVVTIDYTPEQNTDPDGGNPAPAPQTTPPSSAAPVTVLEPALTIEKAAAKESSFGSGVPGTFSTGNPAFTDVDAGDVVFYRIEIENPSGADDTTAFDLELIDALPPEFSGALIYSVSSTGTVYRDGSATALDTTDFAIDGAGNLSFNTGRNYDIEPNSTITLIVQGSIAASVGANVNFTNVATVNWTSIDGATPTATSSFTTDDTERDGSLSPALNDYTATASVSGVTVLPLEITKSVAATSEDHTAGNDVAVGEVVRYRIEVRVPEGTLEDLVIRDQLPDGLQFLDESSVRVAFVSSNSNITSSAFSGAGLNQMGDETTLATVIPSFTLPGAQISSASSDDTYLAGEDIVFSLGDLENIVDNDLNDEFVVIEFDAVVLNDSALNGNKTVFSNDDFTSGLATATAFSTEWSTANGGQNVSILSNDQLLGSDEALRVEANNNNRSIIGQFSTGADADNQIDLGVGEKLTLDFDVRLEEVPNTNHNFRFGLYGDNGSPNSNSSYSGYGTRLATGSNSNSSIGAENTGGGNFFAGNGYSNLGTFSASLNDQEPHHITFEIERTAANTTVIRYYLDGTLVDSQTESSAPTQTSFNAVVFGANNNTAYVVDNVVVAKQPVYSNTATVEASNVSSSPTSNAVDLTLTEPSLELEQTVSLPSGDSGDAVTYTLTVQHRDSSGADAFDLQILDNLPSGFTPTGLTVGGSSGATGADFNLPLSAGATLSTVGTVNLALGQTLVLTITGNLNDTVRAGQGIQNVANLTYTGLPAAGTTVGANPTSGDDAGNDTLSATPGSSGDDDGERDGSGDANYYADHAVTRLTITTPTISKRFADNNADANAGSSDLIGTTGNSVAIGESVLYDILVTLPEGSTDNLRIDDLVPAGFRLDTGFNAGAGYELITTAAASGGQLSGDFTGTITAPAIAALGAGTLGDDGVDSRINFGTVVATGDNAANNSFLVRIQLIATNTAGNQDTGVDLTNQAQLRYDNPAPPPTPTDPDPAADNDITLSDDGPAVTVAEPSLSVVKSFQSTPTDAGDTFVYDLVISNASGANRSSAYEIQVLDQLAAELNLAAITDVTLVSNPGYVSIDANASNTGDGALVDVTLNRLDAGDSITVRISGTVGYSVTPTQTISNAGSLTYTSTLGANPDERTGIGAINDYTATSNTIDFTTPSTSSTKSIAATSETSTSGSNVVIGEIVRYRLEVTIPEGTLPTLTLVDELPSGLSFLNDGTARLSFLADNDITEDAALAGADNDSATPTFVIPAGRIAVNGQEITFDLGTLVNNDNDLDAETIVLEFNALVLNSAGNQDGVVRSNDFETLLDGSSDSTSPAVDVTIVEPTVTLDKVVHSAPANPDAGDLITYHVTLENTSAEATAFDTDFVDSLQDGLTLVGGTLVHVSGTDVTANLNLVDGASSLTTFGGGFSLAPGASTTFEYQVRIPDSVVDAQSLDNDAAVTWTSLPGSGTVGGSNITGSSTPGAAGDGDGERDGSLTPALNDYQASDSESVTANLLYSLTKSVFDTSSTTTSASEGNAALEDLTIGETVTFRLTVTLGEGTTEDLLITDTLPFTTATGNSNGVLEFVSASVISTGTAITAGAPSISNGGTNNALVTFDYGTVTVDGTNGVAAAADRQIVLEVVARASNVAANQSGDLLTNSAELTSTAGDTETDTAQVEIVEPILTLNKTTTTSGADAGDTVVYTLEIENTGNATAYDIDLLDTLDSELELATPGSALAITVNPGYVTLDQSSNTAAAVASVLNELRAGDSVTLTITARLKPDVNPADTVTNTATIRYTSLPDGHPDEGSERDGTGGVDDYEVSDTSTSFELETPTVAKTLVNTSDGNTTDVSIGETVTYDLTLTVRQGVTEAVTLTDFAQDDAAGILEIVGAQISSVGANVTLGSGLMAGNTNTTNPALITISDSGGSARNDQLVVDLGDVTNSNFTNTLGADTIVVRVTARVPNELVNQDGDILGNSVELAYTDGNGDPQTITPAPVNIAVVEPRVTVSKAVTSATTGIDAGDSVTYSVTIDNLAANGATSPAYDVTLSDVLPAGMNITSIDGAILNGGVTVNSPLSGVGTTTLSGVFDLLVDGSITITFTAEVPDTVAPTQVLTADLNVTFTSQNGMATEERDGADIADPEDNTPPTNNTILDNYAVGADASVTAVNPFSVTKSIGNTSQDNDTSANVVIGEVVTYQVAVTVMEGTTSSLQLVDVLPAGMEFLTGSLTISDYNGMTIGGQTAGGSGLSLVQAGQTLTISTASVINPGDSDDPANADSDTFLITYQARVQNVASNQDGTTLTNNLDATATDVPPDLDNEVDVTVVEPRVTIDKSASPTTGLNGGDIITYTVVLNNLAANGATSPAYDVLLTDTVPSGLLITSVVSTTASPGVVTDNGAAITGGGTGLTAQFDIPVDGTVTIVYEATVQSSAVPGQSFVNDADATFTSLDGTDLNERNGSEIAEPTDNTHPDNAGVLDNYAVGDAETVATVGYSPLVTKQIASTSEAGSTGNDVLVGEVVRYQLKFELYEGTLQDLVIEDFLPDHLQFLNDGSASISTLNVDTTATNQRFDVRDSVTGNGTTFGSGTDLFFQLGDVVNNDNDADVEYGVIEFNALVLNTTSNVEGATRDNNFAVRYDSDGNGATDPAVVTTLRVDADDDGTPETTGQSVSNTLTVTIREPSLSFTQTIPAGSGYDAGDTVTITYEVTNSATVPAYNIRLADLTLPAEFDLTGISFTTTGTGGTVTDSTNLVNDAVDAELSQLNAGATWIIEATVTLRDTVNPGDVYTNPADITYTSLPGANGTTGNGTGSDTPGAAGGQTGERTGADGVGGALNDYALTSSAGLSIPSEFQVSKSASQSQASIGEVITYTVSVTVIEGTTTSIQLNDTLPMGMVFVANSANLSLPAGWTISGFANNSIDQTLAVTNPGVSDSTNATATGTFTYTYQARVQNVAGNQSGTVLTNELDATADNVPPDLDNEVDVTVVEPRVTIDKSASPTAGLNGGDIITYTVVLNNLAANGATSPAYDVLLTDTVPSGLLITSVVSTTASPGVVTDDNAAITGGGTGLTAQFDIPVDGTVTIVYEATVQSSAVPGQSFVNDADATFTSLDGTDLNERNGSEIVEPTDNTHPDNAGVLNNYAVGDAETVATVGYSPLVTKQIASTSEAGFTGNDVLVGEVVRYQLKFELYEGAIHDVVIEDFLPDHLQFLNDGSASFSTLNVDTTATTQRFDVRDSVTGNGTTFGSGTDLFFQLGDVVNNDNDTDVEYGVIEFNALVLNTNSNVEGTTRDNNFAVRYDSDGNGATDPAVVTTLRVDANDDGTPESTGQSASNTITVTVREPSLSFTQSIPAGSGYDAGDTFTITYQVTNSASVPAYNIRLADLVLPPEFDLTSISFTTFGTGGSVTDSTNLTTDQIDAELSQLDPGATWTIEAAVTLRDSVNPGDVYNNPADVTYTSLPGINGTTGNATGSDTPGAAGSATGERTGAAGAGGVLNDYALTSSAGLSIPVEFDIAKSVNTPTATIGEVVTYTVTVTVLEGTTTNIQLDDTLPAGTSFVANSASLTTPGGWTISGFNTNSVDQVLTVTNPGSADSNATAATGSFTYTYDVLVRDVPGNDGLDAAADGDGQTVLTNALNGSADTGTGGTVTDSDDASTTVIEPRLVITKANNDSDDLVVPGQILTYTLFVENSAANGSTADAFDVAIRDAIPAGMTYVPGSVTHTGGVAPSSLTESGGVITALFDSLALGSDSTITFQVQVGIGQTAGTNFDNNARLHYDSLPGDDNNPLDPSDPLLPGDGEDRDYGPAGVEDPTPVTDDPHQDTDRVTVGSRTLGDRVWYDLNGDAVQNPGEIGIGNATVTVVYAGDDGVFGNADDVTFPTTSTAANTGNYLFENLVDGEYRVSIDPATLPDGVATVPTFDFDGVGTPHTATVTIAGTNIDTADFGYRGTGSVSDQVWLDLNGDGSLNGLEPGIPGVTLDLIFDANADGVIDAGDSIIATTTTDANGQYSFTDLLSGRYLVQVTDTGSVLDDTTNTFDKDDYGTVALDRIGKVDLGVGETDTGVDFGLRGSSNIGDFVWNDLNGDGVQDSTEPGIAGLTVNLYRDVNGDGQLDGGDLLMGTTTTGAAGEYAFLGLIADDYLVEIPAPPAAATPSFDLDGVITPDVAARTIGSNETASDVDFGYLGAASIGDLVYYDINGDGIRQVTEPPLAGIEVFLDFNANGDFDAASEPSLTTDASGNYLFTGLIGGTYEVRVLQSSLPIGWINTDVADENGGVAAPSLDLNAVNTVTLGATEAFVDADFGYFGTFELSGLVYLDQNRDSSFNGTDRGVEGVLVELYDATGTTLFKATTTDANGNYRFENLLPGDYLVRETQPTGYASSETPANEIPVTIVDTSIGDLNFGETLGTISGNVFFDANANGVRDAGEPGIAGTTLTLFEAGADGVHNTGDDVQIGTTTTANDGTYRFNELLAGNYRVVETQPTGYNDGQETVGSIDGSTTGSNPVSDTLSQIILPAGRDGLTYGFGELGSSISGTVYGDRNRDGNLDGEDTERLAGVTIQLRNSSGTVVATTTTDGSGNYRFTNQPPDTYTIEQIQPNGFGSSTPNTLTVQLGAAPVVGQNFGETRASLSGGVYVDANRNGERDPNESGISGVRILLSGTDVNGNQVELTTFTDANGEFLFDGLLAGNYTVLQPEQPEPFLDGRETAGTNGGSIAFNEQIGPVTIGAGDITTGYLFGERGSVDLVTTKTDGVDVVRTGNVITYTITVRNDGIQDATNVTVTDQLPPRLLRVLSVSNDGVYDPFTGEIRWEIASLAANGAEEIILTITAVVNLESETAQQFINRVTAVDDAANGPDANPANNIAEDVTRLLPTEPGVEPIPTPVFVYAYDGFNDFQLEFEFDDELYIIDPVDVYDMPILTLAPVYSGEAEPGSVLIVALYNANGEIVGVQSVAVDYGGNWVATFPGAVIRDYPQSVVITQTRAATHHHDEAGHNIRAYFATSIHPGQFIKEQQTVQRVMAHLPNVIVATLTDGLNEPIHFEFAKHKHEYLAHPGVPSGF